MSFLGVESSLTGRRWIGPTLEQDRAAQAIADATGFSLPLCTILARRRIPAEEAAAYLSPALRDLLPNPRSLRDTERAAERLVTAVAKGERIAIFADYDVDGGASAALLIHWLRELGQDATLYVPDRIDEGYGPNDAAMRQLAKDHDIILCVDCGTLSHDPIAAAAGTDVVVIDHHLAGETLPSAFAVVNPNRQDEDGLLGHLCAAAVVFLVLVEANRQLREADHKPPDLLGLLDLVALATVADVAALKGVNRAFVRQGLTVMARRQRLGLVALSDLTNLDGPPNAYHLGYVFGPRINAGGRIGAADLGARLLSTADPAEAGALAERLDQLNSERREIEAQVSAEALAQADARGREAPLVWAIGDGWHPGVVGIVASRLKEATNRPAIVIGFNGEEGKGSGRSVAGIDLGAAIQTLTAEGLLEKGGGHRMAAGLTVSRDRVTQAMDRLSELLDRQGAGLLGPSDLRLDGALAPPAATLDLIHDLDKAGPFGAGAPSPRFAFPGLQISFAKEVGDGHLKLTARASDGSQVDAISFGAFSGPLGPGLLAHDGASFHLAGRLEINRWNDRERVQLKLEDAAHSHAP
ncbi:single-stranded-DNA-specific exonuclease RecJ [Aestuariibius insulae]|uniref:single-stranded-DNA-specific exonuclease RecJ n=1 Tax=Aestuariibius insulae TaxID=2058287 RepID=UPI00345F1412